MLIVQVQFGISLWTSDFWQPCIRKISGCRAKRTKLSATAYRVLSLLSVQCQFGVIRCISSFWRLCIYFWFKYSGIFVLPSLYLTGIRISTNWLSRASRPLLGLLFAPVQCGFYMLSRRFSVYYKVSTSIILRQSLHFLKSHVGLYNINLKYPCCTSHIAHVQAFWYTAIS